MKLIFVIQGEDVPMPAEAGDTFSSLRARALAVSRNTGRPESDWEIRNEHGRLLSEQRSVADSEVADGELVFLSLRVGAGGSTFDEMTRALRFWLATV
jgi:hypothetical protein